MTKQYAEMENSREQSRVCARLPLNLQLFAEDTGENGADTNTEGAAGDTGANSDGGNDTPTFDDLLKDKKFQSEFDSRVSKALATARAKWEESAKEQADTTVANAKAEADNVKAEADNIRKTIANYRSNFRRLVEGQVQVLKETDSLFD